MEEKNEKKTARVARKTAVRTAKAQRKSERRAAARHRKAAARAHRAAFERGRIELKLERKRREAQARRDNAAKAQPADDPYASGQALKDRLKAIASEQRQSGDFINLDNAAIIFPASETADMLNMFRLTALLTEPVDPIALQYALNDVVPRFPTFVSAVKKGMFWYYLEPSSKPLVIEEQTKFPCRKIPIDTRHALIRVTYFSHEISVEFFHVASDGNGGVVFLNSLLAAYFKRLGVEIKDKTNYLNHLDLPEPEETVDSFRHFCDPDAPKRSKDVKAYNIPGKRLPSTALILTKGTMSGRELNETAKARGLTVTQLLVACLIWAVERDREMKSGSRRRPVVVNVPANLRKLYPSRTLRNFVSIMPIVSNGADDFDELCRGVREEFDKKNRPEYFRSLVNYNLKVERNPVLKFAPLPAKTLAMRLALKAMSDKVTSTLISNLGRVDAPAEFKGRVARYEFSLSAQSYSVIAVAAATFDDVAVVTAARTVKESVIEKLFFRKLAELGVSIAVETNHTVKERGFL